MNWTNDKCTINSLSLRYVCDYDNECGTQYSWFISAKNNAAIWFRVLKSQIRWRWRYPVSREACLYSTISINSYHPLCKPHHTFTSPPISTVIHLRSVVCMRSHMVNCESTSALPVNLYLMLMFDKFKTYWFDGNDTRHSVVWIAYLNVTWMV